MSSEEETDYCALYGASTDSKQQQLLKKQKRTRQRVDAGEPRNSYSSIPNFSSRPSFLGGGLYGSIFGSNSAPATQHSPQQQTQSGATGSQTPLLGTTSTGPTATQQQQHSAHAAFSFFGAPGFGPAKMLNELLGRQVKQAADAGASPPEGSHGMTGAGMDASANLQPGSMVNCDDPATAAELTQHMLRDILQGRKLSALSGQEQPNNNNNIHSNNNNNTTDLLKHQQQSPQQNSDSARSATVQSGADEESSDDNNVVVMNNNNNTSQSERDSLMACEGDDSAEDVASAARAMEEAFAEAGMDPGANLDPGSSDCEQSLPPSPAPPRSVSVSVKEEIMHEIKRSPSHSPCPIVPKSEVSSSPTTEIKRARVENIVSTMRSSPALQPATVNGCKKRKLYQPQQQTVHHVLQHEQQHTMVDEEEDSEDDEDPAAIRQKREEKDNLKSQLKNLHEQLAVMQQKYMELFSRMEPDTSESSDAPMSPQHQPQPPPRPHRPHPPPYNGLPSDHSHPAAAAAMYHMGQKLYLEQHHATLERIKQQQEAAARQHHHQQQNSPQPPAQPPSQQQHQPPPPAQSQSQSNSAPPSQLTATSNQHKDFQERLNMFRGVTAASASGSSAPHITGADLEGLADILKTEITSSLTNLIDSVVNRFVQQRRFLGKQGEAAQAAAEQLNKDLLLASQLLERKSPRTKVVDRGAAPLTSGPNGPRGPLNGGPPPQQPPAAFPQLGSVPGGHHGLPHSGPTENNLNQINQLPPHVRPNVAMFQTPKPPTIYGMASMQQQQQQRDQHRDQQRDQYCNMRADEREQRDSEQNEALSLVMTPKKKRHKVRDLHLF